MPAPFTTGKWNRGPVVWVDGLEAFISVVFTWHIEKAFELARFYAENGFSVRVGGPGVFTARAQAKFEGVAIVGGQIPDVVRRHNPMATTASRGCPVGCWFCIVPAMEGRNFTLLPEFTPRPVLTDNNLSALPAEYQTYIVDRYRGFSTPLLDANSGFEPKTFDRGVFERWAPINRGVWRFAYDESRERADVKRVIEMLKSRDVPGRKIQVYVLIGNEPFDDCMRRINEVIAWGGEPYTQPVLKLNAPTKDPWVRFDWTAKKLKQVQRWTNAPVKIWRKVDFKDYDPGSKGKKL